jgi:hypothetical protein
VIPRPKASIAARHAVRALEAEGATLSLEDKVWLHSLAKRMENPLPPRNGLLAVGMSVRVGPYEIYPMSIAAGIWYDDGPELWFENEPQTRSRALMFALFHSRNTGFLFTIRTPAEAVDAIDDWWKHLEISGHELAEAIRMVEFELADGEPDCLSCKWMGAEDKDDAPCRTTCDNHSRWEKNVDPDDWEHSTSWENVVAILRLAYGGTAADWFCNESRDVAINLAIHARREQARLRQKDLGASLQDARKMRAGSIAHQNFLDAMNQIRKDNGIEPVYLKSKGNGKKKQHARRS